MNNKTIENIFLKYNPEYQYRWVIYNKLLEECISPETVWLDIGCGKNELVSEFGKNAKYALGIDILDEKERLDAPFLKCDLRSIPLPPNYANVITLRMVVEHLEKIPGDFAEAIRLLIPGGKLIILTTNSLSPLVFLSRLLPYRLKSWMIQKLFSINSSEIFPTYHRFNTPPKMIKGISGMSLVRIEYIEQIPFSKPFLALVFGFWYIITKIPGVRYFRSNLLSIYRKESA